MAVNVDIISNLPEVVLERILLELPIKDAVRTSVLSAKWRYKWSYLPQLEFDNKCFASSSKDESLIKARLLSAVDHALSLHIGPIHKFKLSCKGLGWFPEIDRWILVLSRNEIKEFVLDIWKDDKYKVPSHLFSCINLTHLELFNCIVKPPPTFRGFPRLQTLDLQETILTDDIVESLISSCLLLKSLTLRQFFGCSCLKIKAPNLHYLEVYGMFQNIIFEDTSLLSTVEIGLDGPMQNDDKGRLIEFLRSLPSIETLKIQDDFLQYLGIGNIPEGLPIAPVGLKVLSVDVSFISPKAISAALSLLRCAPNLQKLEMQVKAVKEKSETDFSEEDEDLLNCSFNKLQVVKMTGISGLDPELELIEMLLARSVALKRMSITPVADHKGLEMFKKLLRFKRASAQAEIIFLDP